MAVSLLLYLVDNGWFVGFLETDKGSTVFSLHIEGPDGATGTRAADIALSLLKDRKLYAGG